MKRLFLILLAISLQAAWYTNSSSTPVLATGGEESAWAHGTQFSTGYTGCNDVPFKRIIQDGNITAFRADIAAAGGSSSLVFKVFTPTSGSNVLTWKADSEAFNVTTTGVQEFTLASPIAANVQDLACFYASGGTQLWQTAIDCSAYTYMTCHTPYVSGNQSSTFTATTFNAGYFVNIDVKMAPPFALMMGDSIGEGYQSPPVPPGHYAYYDGELGDVPTQSIYKVQQLVSSSGFKYQNHSAGGQTWAFVASTEVPNAVGRNAVAWIIHCGLNDITSGRNWSQISADLDTIRGLLPAGRHIFLREILPTSCCGLSSGATIQAMNTNYATYVATYPSQFTLIPAFSAMSNGSGNINAALFTSDGIHPNATGQDTLGAIDKPIIEAFYNSIGARVSGGPRRVAGNRAQ